MRLFITWVITTIKPCLRCSTTTRVIKKSKNTKSSSPRDLPCAQGSSSSLVVVASTCLERLSFFRTPACNGFHFYRSWKFYFPVEWCEEFKYLTQDYRSCSWKKLGNKIRRISGRPGWKISVSSVEMQDVRHFGPTSRDAAAGGWVVEWAYLVCYPTPGPVAHARLTCF